jgi:predicted heme/steroid binding protein
MSTSARYRKPAATTVTSPTSTASHEDTVSIPRAPASTTEAKKELKAAVNDQAAKTSKGFGILDILRVLGGLAILSAGLSYLSTSGTSMTWGYNAKWTRMREWKGLFVRPSLRFTPRIAKSRQLTSTQKGQVRLTDTELLAYDGTDPTKPIYLALNGTIYDVSASPQTYGPGGSYHFFAGRDAARAFLTGCFVEDAVPDLRGVERMFIPVDPEEKADASPEVLEKAKQRKALTKGEVKNRNAQEVRQAKARVVQGLESWHSLFRGDKGKPYFKAGVVDRPIGWEKSLPERPLCEQAEKSRPVRKYE